MPVTRMPNLAVAVCLTLPVLLWSAPSWAAPPPEMALDFEELADAWQTATEDGATISASPQKIASGETAMRLEVKFPGTVWLYLKPWRQMDAYNQLTAALQFGEGTPAEVEPQFYFKDSHYWWYETLPFRDMRTGKVTARIKPGKWQEVTLDISPWSTIWRPGGHKKPWYDVTWHPKELGLRFISKKSYEGVILIRPLRFWHKAVSPPARPGQIEAEPNAKSVPQYGKFELTFPVDTYYSNPYDPEVVDVQGHFTAPDGRRYDSPGFFYQAYERGRTTDRGFEKLTPVGPPVWKVRFCPIQQGQWRYHVTIRDTEERRSTEGTFQAAEPKDPRGFVRVSKRDPLYFEFDNGEWYYPVGENVRDGNVKNQEGGQPGTYEMDLYLPALSASGANFVRTWMCAWWAGIEWSDKYDGSRYNGLGRYSQPNAWRLDYTLALAEQLGLFTELTLWNHGQLRRDKYDFEWEYSPWWVVNGGHLTSPPAFWTDPTAKELSRQRLRYIVARWAYSQRLMAWDLWNEVDLVEGYTFKQTDPVVSWLSEMAQYVKEIDPYDHIVTTHYCLYWMGGKEIFAQPEMEYIQADAYWSDSMNKDINKGYNTRRGINKPYLVVEFGRKPQPNIVEQELRNGLWTTVAMPMAGAAVYWQWDLVHELNLYKYFAAVRKFMAGEDHRGRDWQRALAAATGGYECQSMRTDNEAWAYVFNYDKLAQVHTQPPAPQAGVQLRVVGLPDGAYEARFYDTETGEIITTKPGVIENRRLLFELPPIGADMMLKIRRTDV